LGYAVILPVLQRLGESYSSLVGWLVGFLYISVTLLNGQDCENGNAVKPFEFGNRLTALDSGRFVVVRPCIFDSKVSQPQTIDSELNLKI